MGELTGFKKYNRELPSTQKVESRISHFNEFVIEESSNLKKDQSARCMDCGVPFCHSACPLGNKIPDFNNAVYNNDLKKAYNVLKSTNNFPEFTGRICPAPCESACVLGINSSPVAIEYLEKTIVENAWNEGWVIPNKYIERTGKKIAIVGSGPAGLAAADQLNSAGHTVKVYEKNSRPGGLLRYGIPDFKLEKKVIDRRLHILKEEGIEFVCNCEVGKDISVSELTDTFDAVLLCGGSSVPRDLKIEGREYKGIYFAMEYLELNNKRVAGDAVDFSNFNLKGTNVVVIGGGDTGSDCIGTSNRLGAQSITQIELLSKPSNNRNAQNPWPLWPMTLKTTSSHEEGCSREWAVSTKRFISDDNKNLTGIEVVNIQWTKDSLGNYEMKEIQDTKRTIPCDYVFLAMGYIHPFTKTLRAELPLKLDSRNNILCNNYHTSVNKVFAAGDMRRGQSLVVWAISEGREAAKAIDEFLMNDKAILKSNFESIYSM